jgi:hypothetical protein
VDLIARIERAGPKKLLAIDGGGIRGVLALEVLQKIEDLLKAKSGHAGFPSRRLFRLHRRNQHRRDHRRRAL